MKTPSILLTLALSIPLSALAGNNIFVSATKGNDGFNGTSYRPKKTIQAAIQEAKAGDFIIVEEGVYKEKLSFPRNGEDWGGTIHLAPNHKGLAIIDATDLPDDGRPVVDITNRKFITVDGLVIKNVKGTAIKVSGSSHILLDSNDIMNVTATKEGQSTIHISDSKKVILKDNALANLNIGQNAAIRLESSVSQFQATYNVISDVKGAGLVNFGSEGKIVNNEIKRASAGIASQGRNVFMEGNTVAETKAPSARRHR